MTIDKSNHIKDYSRTHAPKQSNIRYSHLAQIPAMMDDKVIVIVIVIIIIIFNYSGVGVIVVCVHETGVSVDFKMKVIQTQLITHLI